MNHVAPEVFKDQNHSLKGDIWQVGCCYYEMFTRFQKSERHFIQGPWSNDLSKGVSVKTKLPKPRAMPKQFYEKVLLEKVFQIEPENRISAFELVALMDEVKAAKTRKKYGIDKNLWKSELRIDNQVKYWFVDNWCCMLTSFWILILLLGSTLFFPIWTCFCETGNGVELSSMKNCSSQYVTLQKKRLETLNCGPDDCYTEHHYELFNQTGYCMMNEIIPTEIPKYACIKSKNCRTPAGKVCNFPQQKRCKTCDTGYKLNIKSFECERTFCECENGKPEAQTCDSVNTHKCESCEYSEVNNICVPIYILLT